MVVFHHADDRDAVRQRAANRIFPSHRPGRGLVDDARPRFVSPELPREIATRDEVQFQGLHVVVVHGIHERFQPVAGRVGVRGLGQSPVRTEGIRYTGHVQHALVGYHPIPENIQAAGVLVFLDHDDVLGIVSEVPGPGEIQLPRHDQNGDDERRGQPELHDHEAPDEQVRPTDLEPPLEDGDRIEPGKDQGRVAAGYEGDQQGEGQECGQRGPAGKVVEDERAPSQRIEDGQEEMGQDHPEHEGEATQHQRFAQVLPRNLRLLRAEHLAETDLLRAGRGTAYGQVHEIDARDEKDKQRDADQ